MFNSEFVIEFANPWVWWLLPLPVLVYLLAPSYRSHSESVQVSTLSELTTDHTGGVQKDSVASKWPYALLGCVWLGLLLAAARPEQLVVSEQQEVSVRDILLVLDISGSMAIRDMQDDEGETSRMQVMQTAVSEFIEKREHDNIGLIVFGSQALPLTPVSQDHNALLDQIDEMVPGMAGPQTSIGDAIGVGIRTYQQMQQTDQAEVEDTPAKERMMILLTDGLDTSSVLPPRVALRLAQTQNIIIHTIAFGDVSEAGNDGSIDTELLKDIAQQTKGSYHQASGSLASLQDVYAAIDKLTPRKMTLVGLTDRIPLFIYPLSMAFLLLLTLLALSVARRKKDD